MSNTKSSILIINKCNGNLLDQIFYFNLWKDDSIKKVNSNTLIIVKKRPLLRYIIYVHYY